MYQCGECHKVHGGRKHRGHGSAKAAKGKTRYQKCMGKQLRKKTNQTTDPQMRMKMAANFCAKVKRKGK